MVRAIDRDKVTPPRETREEINKANAHYLRYRRVYRELQDAYRANQITRQQYHTLRGQVRAGDADGAIRGLATLTWR